MTEPHQPEPRLGDRIVGGIPMDITQAPWQVSLQKDGSHYCGGSIISQTWILTSAYCTTYVGNKIKMLEFAINLCRYFNRLLYIKDVLEVRIGSSYHMVGELYRVIDIIQHHRFNRDNMDFDFALLLLERPLNFGNSIQPVRLPNFGEFPTDNTICLVTGWGDTKNPNESRVQLRGVYLPIVNQQQCNNAYKDYGGITSRMICAGIYPAGGKDG